MPRWKQVSRIFLKESNIIVFQETKSCPLQILLIQSLFDNSKITCLVSLNLMMYFWNQVACEKFERIVPYLFMKWF